MKDTHMDCITLAGIQLWTRIGVPEEERSKDQRILVDLTIFHPTHGTGASDDVTKGINYEGITNAVTSLATKERKTIEKLAEDIATVVIQNWKPQGGVQVTIHKKPNLPLEKVSLTIVRP